MKQIAVWLSLLLILGGCTTRPESVSEAPRVSQGAAQDASPLASSKPEPLSSKERRQASIERWLDDAEQALSENRLLTPVGNNAHDRYRAVLLLDPDNQRAESGLQAVALRYVALARSAAGRGALSEAEAFLDKAREVGEENPVVDELAQHIATERQRRQNAAAVEREGTRYQLNPYQLSARAPELVEELHTLAKQVRETNEFLLIIARTDAEGRWIYQQMREAVPEYRLRGDIRVGAPPHIELQAP